MKRALTAVAGLASLALPFANTAAKAATDSKVAPKKKVVTTKVTVSGDQGSADRWGVVQVTLIVKKVTTTIGAKKTVKRSIIDLQVPVYPNHTDRSVFINQQALPMLEQEVLQVNYSGTINLISGATYTSQGFVSSLQSALLKAQTA